jgi:small-conductance mechanosensitive channel
MTQAAFHHTLSNPIMQIFLTLAVSVLILLLIRHLLERIVRRVVKSDKNTTKTEERRREDTLIRIFRTLSAAAVWIITIVVILGELHVNVAALLTGAGLIGIVAGMGAQNIIKDYLAGILIIAENQYGVGDIVSIAASVGGNVSGVVEDVSIRATRLRDLDGNLHIVSNGSAGVITNLSYKFAQVNVNVGVGYHSDIDKVEQIINNVGQKMMHDAPWSDNIIDPIHFLRVDDFGPAAIIIKSIGKVKPSTQWDTAGEFRRRIKRAFDDNDIEIPVSQLIAEQVKK